VISTVEVEMATAGMILRNARIPSLSPMNASTFLE